MGLVSTGNLAVVSAACDCKPGIRAAAAPKPSKRVAARRDVAPSDSDAEFMRCVGYPRSGYGTTDSRNRYAEVGR